MKNEEKKAGKTEKNEQVKSSSSQKIEIENTEELFDNFNLRDLLSMWLPKMEKKKMRVGRGTGSKKGKTCGRGHKGMSARSGGKVSPGFEGGQMPVYRRMPKVGFTSLTKRYTYSINVSHFPNLDMDNTANIIDRFRVPHYIKFIKFFGSGTNKKVKIRD